jgi:flavin reductase (DIM6/NTAB) family NADH-FMN oxidoreductase RutF
MSLHAKTPGAEWTERPLTEFSGSPFLRIGEDWMLVTAGAADEWNTMTASWGGLGVLWNLPVAFVFIRPTRHTFGFIEKTERFTLSFFDEVDRHALDYCGAVSGRDTDKALGAGLSPIVFPDGAVSFAEAREVLACRKLYGQDLDPKRFLDPSLAKHYPKRDYHRLYVGAIERYSVRPNRAE